MPLHCASSSSSAVSKSAGDGAKFAQFDPTRAFALPFSLYWTPTAAISGPMKLYCLKFISIIFYLMIGRRGRRGRILIKGEWSDFDRKRVIFQSEYNCKRITHWVSGARSLKNAICSGAHFSAYLDLAYSNSNFQKNIK